MEKNLKKWMRRLHRWLVLPFTALLLTALLTRGTALGSTAQRIQAPLMIVMAITGLYLYLLPYWSRWRRGKTQKTSASD